MSNFIEQYQNDKKVRDLIKRKMFKSTDLTATWRYDSHDLDFKITHIKKDCEYGSTLSVNVNVSGRMKGWSWRTDSDGLCRIENSDNFRSSISRNRELRRLIEKSVARELVLYGVEKWRVNIGRLNIKDSI